MVVNFYSFCTYKLCETYIDWVIKVTKVFKSSLITGVLLHRFPNPSNPSQIERFRTWVMKIGGDIVKEDNGFIYRNRKVCHKHFQDQYIFPSMKLSALAIPTLQIPGKYKFILYNTEHLRPVLSTHFLVSSRANNIVISFLHPLRSHASP